MIGTAPIECSNRSKRLAEKRLGLSVMLALLATFATLRPIPALAKTTPFDLAELIKRQTEEFSAAGRKGDRATLDRLLDRNVVFMTEDGSMPSRQDIIEGAAPAGGTSTLTVTDFRVRRQGSFATATFIDVLKEDFHGIPLTTNYHSTEIWAKRGGKWKLAASQTMIVPAEPSALVTPVISLGDYVGTYEIAPDVKTAIVQSGGGLIASTNGGAPHPLAIEYRDVLFAPGAGSTTRYMLRDSSGRITGYIVRLTGHDLFARKVD